MSFSPDRSASPDTATLAMASSSPRKVAPTATFPRDRWSAAHQPSTTNNGCGPSASSVSFRNSPKRCAPGNLLLPSRKPSLKNKISASGQNFVLHLSQIKLLEPPKLLLID